MGDALIAIALAYRDSGVERRKTDPDARSLSLEEGRWYD